MALASALVLAGGACGDNEHGAGGEGPGEPPPGGTVPGAAFRRVDLVSDQQGLAPRVASELVNPWGIARGEGGFWIADEGSGAISIFNAAGEPAHGEYTSGAINLGAGITGIAANPTDGFRIHGDSVCCTPAEFVIASMGGRLFGVSGDVDANRGFVLVECPGAVYTGVAIGMDGDQPRLYAADFLNGRIDVFDADLREVDAAGAFVDPELPKGYAPFNVAALGGRIYVAYAFRSEDEPDEEVQGPGLGVIDVYEMSGVFVRRLATGGALNAPWGMAIAPAGFGAAGGMLLVGNLGDGRINPFGVESGRASDPLSDDAGAPIEIDGLWGIIFGGGDEDTGDANVLYFTAGPDDETHGVFGRIVFAE